MSTFASSALVGACHPERVGVEQEDEDERDRHQVHVDAEDHAGVIKAPTAADAADRVGGANDGEERRDDEVGGGSVVREAGEKEGGYEADEYEEVSAHEGLLARIEDGEWHSLIICWMLVRVGQLACAGSTCSTSEIFSAVEERHTPGAKAPFLWRLLNAKAKALAYLEAKAKAGEEAKAKAGEEAKAKAGEEAKAKAGEEAKAKAGE